MSLARGKFGIEYNPRQMEREPSGLGGVLAVIALVALISLTWTTIKRVRAAREEAADNPVVEQTPAPTPEKSAPDKSLPIPAMPMSVCSSYSMRPAKVRNLLMRLEEATKRRDVEMAVSTIETIRSLPGSPAADLDDALARRLGQLNIRRLFDEKNAQWVKQVTVKRGDSATRIAAENGSTFASFVRLNGGNVGNNIRIGSKLYVMDHPRFNLVIHRRTRTADLSLNGKFFKRYDLPTTIKAKEGAYELPEKKRVFFSNILVSLAPADLSELETLLPTGTPVLISEM